jgi:signal transduction histidine kinase
MVEVIDNGRGNGTPSRSGGLTNMRRRAETTAAH